MKRDERTKRQVRSIRFSDDEVALVHAIMKRDERSFTYIIKKALRFYKAEQERLHEDGHA